MPNSGPRHSQVKRSMTSCTQAHHLITPESPTIPWQQPSGRTLRSPWRARQSRRWCDMHHVQGLTSQDPPAASASAPRGTPRPAAWQTLSAQLPAPQPQVRPPPPERQATAGTALGKHPQRGCQPPCCPPPAEVRLAGLLPCICCWRPAPLRLPAASHHRICCGPCAFQERDASAREATSSLLLQSLGETVVADRVTRQRQGQLRQALNCLLPYTLHNSAGSYAEVSLTIC